MCVSCSRMDIAQGLLKRMTASPDVITYNTLLKGYCQQQDLQAA